MNTNQPHVDRYGDPLPPGAVVRLGTTRLRHGDIVSSLAFSPDGNRLASSSWEQTISIWEVPSGSEVRRLVGHTGEVFCVAFSPDGNRVASSGIDGTVRLWDIDTGTEVAVVTHGSAVSWVCFSHDGRTVAYGGGDDGKIGVCGASDGKGHRRWSGHSGGVQTVAMSRRGILASGGRDDRVCLWDPETGGQLATFTVPGMWTNAVAFSPDGQILTAAVRNASALDQGGPAYVRMWHCETGDLVREYPSDPRGAAHLHFSPDGSALAVAEGTDIRILDANTGEIRREFALGDFAWFVTFSPDGRYLAATSQRCRIALWEMPSGRNVDDRPAHEDVVASVDFSPDGEVLASAGQDATMRLWDPRSGEERLRAQWKALWTGPACFSPDGGTLAVPMSTGDAAADETAIVLWNVARNRTASRLFGHKSSIDCLEFSRHEGLLASGSRDGSVRLWDARTDEPLLAKHFRTEINTVCFSSSGRLLAVGGDDGVLRILDTRSYKTRLRARIARKDLYRMAFSRDDRLIAFIGGIGDIVSLWSTQDKKLFSKLALPRNSYPHSISFSPDGRILAAGAEYGEVVLWDTHTWELLGSFRGHRGLVGTVAFSPDGTRLASGSTDCTGLIWDIASLETSSVDPT